MILLEEEMSFTAGDFEALEYRFHLSAMGNETRIEYTFSDGVATGNIVGGQGQEGPRDVSVELVDGCVVGGILE